jgi:hypothetical protein
MKEVPVKTGCAYQAAFRESERPTGLDGSGHGEGSAANTLSVWHNNSASGSCTTGATRDRAVGTVGVFADVNNEGRAICIKQGQRTRR